MRKLDNKRQSATGLALFLCLLLALSACEQANVPAAAEVTSAPAIEALCRAETSGLERVRVERVVDGDTVRLANGESLRLIGINTPEVGRDGAPSQPLAEAATRELKALVRGEKALWLQAGREHRDRHGRLLGHLFSADGDHLGAQLLRQGLGFQVAIAPNLQWFQCLHQAENVASDARAGVWGQRAYRFQRAGELPADARGFTLIRDRVSRVSFKDKAWWVQLGGKVSLRIDRRAQHLFSSRDLQALEGRTVESRGWLTPMRGDWWMMRLDHPVLLQVVD